MTTVVTKYLPPLTEAQRKLLFAERKVARSSNQSVLSLSTFTRRYWRKKHFRDVAVGDKQPHHALLSFGIPTRCAHRDCHYSWQDVVLPCSLLKTCARQLSDKAHDSTISTMYEGHTANGDSQNMISLKNANCVEAISMTVHLLIVFVQIAFPWQTILHHILRIVTDRTACVGHVLIHRVLCEKVYARALIAVFGPMSVFFISTLNASEKQEFVKKSRKGTASLTVSSRSVGWTQSTQLFLTLQEIKLASPQNRPIFYQLRWPKVLFL